jgi:RND family efflux transporter MFP subunit
VTGSIKKIVFSPGDEVIKGQALFQIDPSSFQVALEQAKANVEKSKAKLQNDLANFNRAKKLVKNGYVSQQQYDQARATAAIQTATVTADEAVYNQALIQLNHTEIAAPISGKTGNLIVKEGDLVTANSETPLVTINQLDSVLANFNLPQNNLPELLSYFKKNPIEVEVWNESRNKLLGKGKLDFIDNNVNSSSGTILLKARIPQSNRLLWPGLMVSVKLIFTTEMNALVVPDSAIKVDQEGNFVYRIINGKAIATRVTVNRQVGQSSVIQTGLSLGDQIITTISPNVKNKSDVQIAPP